MANTFYPKGKEHWAKGDINWLGNTIMVQLIDLGAYTYSTLHEFLSDIPLGARVGDPVEIASGKTCTNGILDGNDVVFLSLTGPTVEAFIIYKDTTVEATSPLLMFFDTAVGLVLQPNSGNVPLVFDNGANRIAKL